MRRIGRKNRRSKKNILAISIFLLVLVGGLVGYASLHETLTIEGNTTVAKNVWDVRFNNVQVLDNNAQVETAPQPVDNGTKVNFVIKLDKPGDSYSFTVDVENNGDIDAMIGTKSLVDGLAAKTNYLDYQLSYIDGVEIEEKNLLKKGEKDTIKFSVKFKKDITASDLETAAEQSLTITLTSTYVQADNTAQERNKIVCKKATTLHTEICNRTDSNGCRADGYTNGATITYGHTNGSTLTSGYALDCDVSGNGDYERFYYVSDLYTGTVDEVDQFDSDYAVLIYYKNIDTSGKAYYNENNRTENWHGPVTLLSSLPTRSTWANENIELKTTSRTIYAETGTTSIGSYNIENPFNYTGAVGRLLTTQEIDKAVGSTSRTTTGFLNNTEYLMEDTMYSNESACSGESCFYFLETPYTGNSNFAWYIGGIRNCEYYVSVNNNSIGARPVIEVKKSMIKLN